METQGVVAVVAADQETRHLVATAPGETAVTATGAPWAAAIIVVLVLAGHKLAAVDSFSVAAAPPTLAPR